MNNKRYILESISELKALQGVRVGKYQRNYRLYENSLGVNLDNLRSRGSVGYYRNSVGDTSPDISLNVIKSCIDTLTSQMAQLKARPYFNTVNGSWRDIQVTKTAQRFFDQYYEKDNINKEVTEAFRNACIFDTGIVFVNPFDRTVRSVLPWSVYYRPAEDTYGNITKAYYELRDYPTSLIPDYKGKQEYTTYGYYFDTVKHIAATLLADTNEVTVTQYTASSVPFLFLHYQRPIVGSSSSSVTDILCPIQLEINFLLNRYKDASQKNPAQTFFVPEGSNIEAYKLNNGVGNVVTYSLSPNMSTSPVTVSTPSFIDGQYLDGVERLKRLAQEMIGLSETSVTGTKPAGVESGVALETLDNIENQRFQTQTDLVVRSYKDLTRIIMEVFPPDEDILSEDMFTSPYKWSDIVALSEKMKVQFSVSDNISKDPSNKIRFVQMLKDTGLTTDEMLLQMLDMPDIDYSYNYNNNTWNAIQTVLNRCVNEGLYDVPIFISIPDLQKEILNSQLILFSANPIGNTEAILRLTKLFEVCFKKSQRIQQYVTTGEVLKDAD